MTFFCITGETSNKAARQALLLLTSTIQVDHAPKGMQPLSHLASDCADVQDSLAREAARSSLWCVESYRDRDSGLDNESALVEGDKWGFCPGSSGAASSDASASKQCSKVGHCGAPLASAHITQAVTVVPQTSIDT